MLLWLHTSMLKNIILSKNLSESLCAWLLGNSGLFPITCFKQEVGYKVVDRLVSQKHGKNLAVKLPCVTDLRCL